MNFEGHKWVHRKTQVWNGQKLPGGGEGSSQADLGSNPAAEG